MTPGRWAPACLCVLGSCVIRPAHGGVWIEEPVVGLTGDYATNPALLNIPGTAESHGALLVDAPLRYVGDGRTFSVDPSARLSNSHGYSSLDSDYGHLNARLEFDTERSTTAYSTAFSRESSLYHDFLLNGSAGARRDSAGADVLWNRSLTERCAAYADVSFTRVSYSESVGAPTLTDYKYLSLAPGWSWDEQQRGKFTAGFNAGLYNSRDGTTQSKSLSGQVGYTRQLNSLWTASATGGFSRALNRADEQVVVPVFTSTGLSFQLVNERFKSSQNSTVFSASLNRQGALVSTSVSAVRQVVPTGLAYLSRQDTYSFQINSPISPRWTLNANLAWNKYQSPSLGRGGALSDVTTESAQASAAWRWTERWTVTLNATRLIEKLSGTRLQLSNTGVSLQLSRRFDRITL